jgi:Glutathione S-transferase
LKLYDLSASPNTRRVRIFIAEKNLEIEMIPIDMLSGENKTEEYLAKNPLGRMPLLELDDGTCIAESIAICRYLENEFPDPPLFGTNSLEKAMIEMWQRRMEFQFLNPLIDIFRNTHEMWKDRIVQIPQVAEIASEGVKEQMVWLNQELEGKEYIAEGGYSVADITAPMCFCNG